MKKKILALCTLLCIAVLSFSLMACNPDQPKEQGQATSFVSLDINPSIELTLDENNKIISVYGANEDAQVLLYNESGIVGVDVEIAVEKITSLAIELGYLDENNSVVQTSVSSANESLVGSILGKVNAKITATATDLNLSVSCDGEGAYSLLRKLEQLKAQYPDNEKIQSLTPDKFKLVVSATENGEISIEAAVELNASELIKLISDAHTRIEEYATNAYNEIKSQACAAYDKAVGEAVDGIFTSYYMANHPMNAYYGMAYQGYKYSARMLYAMSDALAFAEKACEHPLDEAQIAAVATALGVGENVDELKNSDGEITVNSIYAYADKMFKNSDASADIEDIKAQLNSALDGVESQIQDAIDLMSEEYETEINEVKAMLDEIVGQINDIIAMLPQSIKTQIEEIVSDITEVADEAANILLDGKITSDEVRALAAKIESKSNDILSKIEKDLSDEELAEIRDLQDKAIAKLTQAKEQMDNAIAEAQAQAKAKLEQLKSQRTDK